MKDSRVAWLSFSIKSADLNKFTKKWFSWISPDIHNILKLSAIRWKLTTICGKKACRFRRTTPQKLSLSRICSDCPRFVRKKSNTKYSTAGWYLSPHTQPSPPTNETEIRLFWKIATSAGVCSIYMEFVCEWLNSSFPTCQNDHSN